MTTLPEQKVLRARRLVLLLVLGVAGPVAQNRAIGRPAPNPIAALAALALGLLAGSADALADPTRRTWEVDGVLREALVAAPEEVEGEPAPLVFVFHGHGGRMQGAARGFAIHELWPEAIVVYPQGLKTPGRLTDPEGKRSGWQAGPGAQEDRDLRFFDAVLASLREDHDVDPRRIHATGHSNGGGFTYLLWSQRGELFASFAPSSAVALRILRDATLIPRPVLHVAGSGDRLVLFSWQEQTIEGLRENNRCGEGRPWKEHAGGTLYPSDAGAPVITLIHDGGHKLLRSAPERMVEFFREHPLPEEEPEPEQEGQPESPVSGGG